MRLWLRDTDVQFTASKHLLWALDRRSGNLAKFDKLVARFFGGKILSAVYSHGVDMIGSVALGKLLGLADTTEGPAFAH